jgi:hypothetical protein
MGGFGGFVGGAIGFAVGGPVGAALGFGLGSSLGAAQQQNDASQQQVAAAQEAAAAQRRQAELQQKQADIANARALRSAVRQARIASASIVNSGANFGTQFSSGVVGGVQSVEGQNRTNISFFNQSNDINAGITQNQIDVANSNVKTAQAQASSAEAGALGKLGGTIFDAAGGFKTLFSMVG